jgi:arylsulfatase A-like enzyme
VHARRALVPAVVCSCMVLSGGSATPVERAAGRPNILIIVTDDQRFGTLGSMPRTRSMLVNHGVSFPHAYGTTPLCCPARASIFTGRYAHNHHVWLNAESGWKHLDQRNTLQRYLQRAGYRTAIAGKYFNDWDLPRRPPSFDRWWVFSPGSGGSGGYFDTRWNLNGRVRSIHTYSTDFVADRAIGFIRSRETHDRQPWLLYAAPFAPHEPATPATRDANASVPGFHRTPAVRERDRSDKPPYARTSDLSLDQTLRLRTAQLRSLLAVDDLVFRTVRSLEMTNEIRRTLIVFVSDNGFLWEDHGLERKGPPYLEGIRIPLVIRWTGHLREGSVDGRRAANIDIAPTIMDAAGLRAPSRFPMDGRSLLDRWRRVEQLTEFHHVHTARPPTWAALETTAFHYVEYFGRGGAITFREYYDLRHDPWELVNLLHDGIPGNDPAVAPLHRRLTELRRCSGTTCP